MSFGYFDTFSYKTPWEGKPGLWERITRHHRFYFTAKYASAVFTTRKDAIRGTYDRKAWADSSFFIFRFIEKSGGRFDITGMENIIKDQGPVVFICNHMGTLETMILPSLIAPHREVTFVVKESLVKHPLFGHVMRSRDPIVVGRTDPRKDFEEVMTKGPELISKGTSIVIFPQSTRSTVFKPEEFNSLGVKLAKKTGVNVVPVALKTDFWGQGRIIKELGPLDSKKIIYFKFGESFPVTGNGKAENQKIIDFIHSCLTQWA
ncbi:MAG: lysophospholipid acyltransferase family protein [Bacteroidota bacterium]|nr:lysophospholipid acyltransferase family protein [Bacteroidota bacterium]